MHLSLFHSSTTRIFYSFLWHLRSGRAVLEAIFTVGNKKELQGARSRLQGVWGIQWTTLLSKTEWQCSQHAVWRCHDEASSVHQTPVVLFWCDPWEFWELNSSKYQWFRLLVAGLSPRRPGFAPVSIHVGFVVDKVALGQVFSEFFGFPLSISFHRGYPNSYHLGNA
jgi:hypothetical protein